MEKTGSGVVENLMEKNLVKTESEVAVISMMEIVAEVPYLVPLT